MTTRTIRNKTDGDLGFDGITVPAGNEVTVPDAQADRTVGKNPQMWEYADVDPDTGKRSGHKHYFRVGDGMCQCGVEKEEYDAGRASPNGDGSTETVSGGEVSDPASVPAGDGSPGQGQG